MNHRVQYVNRAWLAQLMEYLKPQERFVEPDSHGLIVSTFGGNIYFVDEWYRPPEAEPAVLTEAELDRLGDE